jgi:predicted transcriptional regulator
MVEQYALSLEALSDDNGRQILLLLENRDMTQSWIARHFNLTLQAMRLHIYEIKRSGADYRIKTWKKIYSIN